MSRHLDNLQRLFQKLHFRYGPEDALVSQVQQEIDSLLTLESGFASWADSYGGRVAGAPRASRLEPMSGNTN